MTVSAMATKKELMSRLHWLVSKSYLKAIGPTMTALTYWTITVASIAIATAQLVNATDLAEGSQSNQAIPQRTAEKARVVLSRDPSPATPCISVRGIVQDSNGKRMSGVNVALRAKLLTSDYPFSHNREVLASTTTNANGEFDFENVGIPPRMIEAIDKLHASQAGAEVLVWGEGMAIAWKEISAFQNESLAFELQREADVEGTIVDDAGKPVHEADFHIEGLTRSTADVDEFFTDPGDLRLVQSELRYRAISKNGRFRIPHLPPDYRAIMYCVGKNGEMARFFIDTGKNSFDSIKARNASKKEVRVYRSPIELVAEIKPFIKVRVVDHQGNPVTEGTVEAAPLAGGFRAITDLDTNGNAILVINHVRPHRVRFLPDPLSPILGLVQPIVVRADEANSVELRLPETRILEGKVIDTDNGKPIVGAYIQATNSSDFEDLSLRPVFNSTVGVSGSDGVFRMAVSAGDWVLLFQEKIDSYFVPTNIDKRTDKGSTEVVRIRISNDGPIDPVTMRVNRGLIIHGSVIDEQNKPVAHTIVRIENHGEPWRTVTTTTDAKGNFVAKGLSPYIDNRIVANTDNGSAEEIIAAYPDQSSKPILDRSIEKKVELRIIGGVTLSGRVTYQDKPMAGVHLKLYKGLQKTPNQRGTRYALHGEIVTDSEGRYKVAGLQKGDPYYFEVSPVGKLMVRSWRHQSPTTQTIHAEPGSTIELPDARLVSNAQILQGVVVTPSGEPIANIIVSARLASQGILPRISNGSPTSTQTDNQGRFVIKNLPDEAIELMAYKSNPGGGRIFYPSNLNVPINASEIRLIYDPTLGSGIEDLDAK